MTLFFLPDKLKHILITATPVKKLLLLGSGAVGFASLPILILAIVVSTRTSELPLEEIPGTGMAVLAAQSEKPNFIFNVNVPSYFTDDVSFEKDVEVTGGLTVKGKAVFTEGVSLENNNLDLGTGELTASNVVYSISVGDGLSVTPGQNPTITNTGVLSVQGKTGAVTLEAGSGIAIDGLKISSTKGDQNLFKTIAISGQSDITAGSSTETLTFEAGSGITLTTDSETKKVTIVADGFGNTIDGGLTITSGSLDLNGGGIVNAGAITGATGFTSSGTITFSSLTEGILHAGVGGVLSSSALNLAGGLTEIAGLLPVSNGGTGLTSYSTGDIIYSSSANTLAVLGIGGEGEVLTVDATGVPVWATAVGGGGSCTGCVLTDPGSSQTITPSASGAIGLSVRQASGGSVDVFSVTNNAGTTKYLQIDSTGNLGVARTAMFGTSSYDQLVLAPTTAGANSFMGIISSDDLTDVRRYYLPDSSGTFCLTTGNCNGVGGNFGGTGTTNYLAKFTNGTTVGDSAIYDNGNIGIGTTSPLAKLYVVGDIFSTGNSTVGGTFDATGAARLASTLRVTGATSLLSTLNVSGSATLSATLNVTGNSQIGGTLGVTGNVGIGTTAGDKLLVLSTGVSGIRSGFDDNGMYWSRSIDGGYNASIIRDSASNSNAIAIGYNSGTHNFRGANASTLYGVISANSSGAAQGTLSILNIAQVTGITGGANSALTIYSDDASGGGNGIVFNRSNRTAANNNAISVWQYNGSEIGRFTASGNFGIGTTTPTGLLHVNGAPIGKALAILNQTGNQALFTASASGATKFIIANDGNVGIGTSAPAYLTDVIGTAADYVMRIRNSVDGSGVTTQNGLLVNIQGGASNNTIAKFATGTNASNSIFTIGTNAITSAVKISAPGGTTVSNSGYGFSSNDSDGGILSPADGVMSFWTNGAERMRLVATASTFNGMSINSATTPTAALQVKGTGSTSSTSTFRLINSSDSELFKVLDNGNVGIGTANPGAKLDVNGSIYVRTGSVATDDIASYGGVNYLQIRAADNLRLITNANERIRIDNAGNTGIGTTTTSDFKLTVAGNIGPDGNGTRDLGSSSNYFNTLYVNNIIGASTGTSGYWQRALGAISPTNTTDDLLLGSTATASALVKIGGTSGASSYFNTGGNFGIGTSSPTNKFEVSGQFSLSTGVAGGAALYSNSSSALTLQSTNSQMFFTANNIELNANSTGYLDFRTAYASRLRVANSGNIGIGTTTPTGLLHVNGAPIGKALTIFNQTGDQDIFTASASGTTKFVINNSGNVGIGNDGSLRKLQVTSPNGSTTNTLFTTNDFVTSGTGSSFAIDFGATSGNTYSRLSALSTGQSAWNNLILQSGGGNVGIGTTSPLAALQVQSGAHYIRIDPANAKLAILNSGNAYGEFTVTNASGFTFNLGILASGRIQSNSSLVSSSNGTNNSLPAGVVDLWSAAGNPSYISFNEATVATRGILGVPAGSGDLTYRGGSATTMANGIEFFRVNSSGNFGIGTTAPTGLLHVNGAPVGKALAIFNQTGNQDIFAASTSGTTKFVISNSGNVGIGTASPQQAINLYDGKIRLSGAWGRTWDLQKTIAGLSDEVFAIYNVSDSYTNFVLRGDTKDVLLGGSVGSGYTGQKVTIQGTSGNVGIGSTSPIGLLNVSGSSIGKALAIFNETGDQALLAASASGVTKFVVNNSGNIGIGTTAPGYPLHVSRNTTSDVRVELQNTYGSGLANIRMLNTDGTKTVMLEMGGISTSGTTAGITNVNLARLQTNSNFVLGTNNSNPLVFTTANSERMRIDSGGNVGIGNTAPTHALTFPTASTGISLYNTSDQTTNYERAVLSWSSNNLLLNVQKGGSGTQRGMKFGTNGVNAFGIDPANNTFHIYNSNLLFAADGGSLPKLATDSQGGMTILSGVTTAADITCAICLANSSSITFTY